MNRWRASKSDNPNWPGMSYAFCTAKPRELSELVSCDFDHVYDVSTCRPRDRRLVSAIHAAVYLENPELSTWVITPSGAPGRIGLDEESAANGNTPSIGWLMLREIRRFAPREPEYPIVRAAFGATCRCRLTFHESSDPLRNRGSIEMGARPAG